MILCKICNRPMVRVREFTKENKGSHEEFTRCRKCNFESKHKVVSDEKLSFDEILHNKMSERK